MSGTAEAADALAPGERAPSRSPSGEQLTKLVVGLPPGGSGDAFASISSDTLQAKPQAKPQAKLQANRKRAEGNGGHGHGNGMSSLIPVVDSSPERAKAYVREEVARCTLLVVKIGIAL